MTFQGTFSSFVLHLLNYCWCSGRECKEIIQQVLVPETCYKIHYLYTPTLLTIISLVSCKDQILLISTLKAFSPFIYFFCHIIIKVQEFWFENLISSLIKNHAAGTKLWPLLLFFFSVFFYAICTNVYTTVRCKSVI